MLILREKCKLGPSSSRNGNGRPAIPQITLVVYKSVFGKRFRYTASYWLKVALPYSDLY